MCRTRNTRRGITRIEVVVVFVVLLLLATLLLPAGPISRGAGKRNTCANNMRNIGLAAIRFAEEKQHFPGHANTVGDKSTSWVVPLLPYLDRNDLYTKWQDPSVSSNAAPTPALAILICPSDPTRSQQPNEASLSYIINAGEATHESAANGICHDLTAVDPIHVSIDYIVDHDGAENTLLMSESLLAGPWTIASAAEAKLRTAGVWHSRKTPTPAMHFDGKTDGATRPNKDLEYARPSSAHPGGANVTFVDGHLHFIANDIDYAVYCQLMTPNGAESDDPIKRTLKDRDY